MPRIPKPGLKILLLALAAFGSSIASAASTARGLLYKKVGSVERARADYQAALAANSKFEDDT